ncbi:hypothetical protein [Treponema putidum]|uniref:hypothetical protein n=1 Tax=Treponema putidum TaxID=221027 RepID=UPI003D93EAAD
MDKQISVYDLLTEHMKFLSVKAAHSKGEKQAGYIEAMEDIQILMNRLRMPCPEEEEFNKLFGSFTFLRLTYDSKVLILDHTRQLVDLKVQISRFMDFLEYNPKMQKKLRRSVAWKLFKLFCRLPWGF